MGMKQRVIVDRVSKLLSLIAKTKVDKISDEIVDLIRIPLALLTPAVVRTHKVKKTIDRKIVEKTVPIHYNRPSKLAEVIMENEKSFLKDLEGPWEDVKNINEQYPKGVKIDEINSFIKRYKTAYEKQIETTTKLAGWRARRRQAMTDYLPKGKQARKFKDSDKDDFVAWICKSKDKNTAIFSNEAISTFNIMKLRTTFGRSEDSEILIHLEPSRLVRENSVQLSLKYLNKDKHQAFLRSLSWIDPESDLGTYIGLWRLFKERRELEKREEGVALAAASDNA
jgi:hypothetical protein